MNFEPTEDQKERYLKRLLSGEGVICVGMTESEAGSAVTDLQTTATPDGAGYRINGTKVFTTHAQYADVMLVYVRFGPGVGGIGSVLVERNAPGVKQGRPSRFLNGEEWVQTYFDNTCVPPENVVLKEGGFKKQIAGFNVERIGNTARSLAFGRHAYETARQWAMQVMGGMGYTEETLVEYCSRKTRGWMIAGGSIEILKNRIAEGVFGRQFSQRPPKA
ncbi:MAG: acyl-CoA dehydrogenase [Betaproteobacteria bacterium]|nr:acyl-CoA dehydrogenase [Betaproteobacteria bacterium]